MAIKAWDEAFKVLKLSYEMANDAIIIHVSYTNITKMATLYTVYRNK
jgi:hypothetical protein